MLLADRANVSGWGVRLRFGRALRNSLLTGNLGGHSRSGAQGSDYRQGSE
jgi:hypothetical protein